MIIKILGSGCANCHRLEANTRDALATLGLDATVEKVTDFADIASYGVMRPPAWSSTSRSWSPGASPTPPRSPRCSTPSA